MSSRSAAKKLAKPKSPGRSSAKVAKAKAGKKPLAKVTKLPKPAAKVHAPKPLPPPARPPMMGMPRRAEPALRPAAPSRQAEVQRPPAPPPAPLVKRPVAPPPRPPGPSGAPGKQSLARSFYWSELRVGDDLPPLSKPPVDRVQIARHAAASNDFNRLHLDEPFAHALGFPGIFAPGALAMGFVGQLLSSWLRRGHVRKLSARFVKIVWPGDELTCHGRIAELRKEAGACYADVELWAENRKGELVLRGQAICELYEAPGGGASDGAGLLFALDGTVGHPARPKSSPPPPKKK